MTKITKQHASNAATTTAGPKDRFRLKTNLKAGGLTIDQLHASMANNIAKQNVTDHH